MYQIGCLPTIFNNFHFIKTPNWVSTGSLVGLIGPKNWTFRHLWFVNLFRYAFINVRTLSLDIVRKIEYHPTMINNFLTLKPPTGTQWGHLWDWFDQKIECSDIFGYQIYASISVRTLWTLNRIPSQHHQQFSVFKPAIGESSWSLVKLNWQKYFSWHLWLIDLIMPSSIDLRTVWIDSLNRQP